MKYDGLTISARTALAMTKHRQATVRTIINEVYEEPPKNARSLIWNVLRRLEKIGIAKRLIRRRCGRNPGTIWTAIG